MSILYYENGGSIIYHIYPGRPTTNIEIVDTVFDENSIISSSILSALSLFELCSSQSSVCNRFPNREIDTILSDNSHLNIEDCNFISNYGLDSKMFNTYCSSISLSSINLWNNNNNLNAINNIRNNY